MRYKLTVDYEANDRHLALIIAERVLDSMLEVAILDHTLEVQINEDRPDQKPEWDEVEIELK